MSFFSSRRQAEPAPPLPNIETPPAPKPPVPQSPVGFETVLGTNSVMEGMLRSNANVRLDGTFSGTLEINGNILVGETAKITADINARNISIAGAVRGNVSGKKVQLLRTGRVWGDIRATALTTEEGAFIDGKITMVSHEAASQPLVDELPPQPPESEIPVEVPPASEEVAPAAPDTMSPAEASTEMTPASDDVTSPEDGERSE